ncbi:hypothetical protein HDU67_006251 [Dinochytrium kinnereticum]|nr:hypothetical protein HDU67_006251 [Dinochytrium kinnereticum]
MKSHEGRARGVSSNPSATPASDAHEGIDHESTSHVIAMPEAGFKRESSSALRHRRHIIPTAASGAAVANASSAMPRSAQEKNNPPSSSASTSPNIPSSRTKLFRSQTTFGWTLHLVKQFFELLLSFFYIIVTDGAATGQKSTPIEVDQFSQTAEEREVSCHGNSIFCVVSDEWRMKARLRLEKMVGSDAVNFDSLWREMIRTKITSIVKRFGLEALGERGHHGETVLHYAMLRKQIEVVEALLDYDCVDSGLVQRLVNMVYEGPRYWGEHACHLAVVVFGDDITMLDLLIKKGADVHMARARGTFFQPYDSFFAACMGHRKIVEYLINEVNVDPNLVDHLGNNVLHVLAFWGYRSDTTTSVDDDDDIADEKNMASQSLASDFSDYYGNSTKTGESAPNQFLKRRKGIAELGPRQHGIQGVFWSFKRNIDGESKEELEALPSGVIVGRDSDMKTPPDLGKFLNVHGAPSSPLMASGTPKLSESTATATVHHETFDTLSSTTEHLPFLPRQPIADGRFVENRSKKQGVQGIYAFLNLSDDRWTQTPWRFVNLSPRERLQYSKAIARKADDSLANYSGLTPFLVAVGQGRRKMVQALLASRAKLIWEYGPVSLSRYCLSELDTVVDKNTMNHHRGALEVAVANEDIGIITLPIFQQLLHAKWRLYGFRVNLSRFLANLFYMILLSVGISLLPNNEPFYESDRISIRKEYFNGDSKQIARLVVETLLVVANCIGLVRESIEWAMLGRRYWVGGFGSRDNLVQFSLIVLFFAVVVFRATNLNDWEVTFLGLLALFGQAIYLQMAPAADRYARVAMEASSNDTFGQNESERFKDWSWMPGGFIWGIRYVYGQGSYDDLKLARQRIIALILFLVAILIMTVLLLNLFVAMLNTTFTQVFTDSEQQWRLQYARLIMEIDEKIISRYNRQKKRSRLYARPITRIGVSRIAPFVKAMRPSDVQANRKPANDMSKTEVVQAANYNRKEQTVVRASTPASVTMSSTRLDEASADSVSLTPIEINGSSADDLTTSEATVSPQPGNSPVGIIKMRGDVGQSAYKKMLADGEPQIKREAGMMDDEEDFESMDGSDAENVNRSKEHTGGLVYDFLLEFHRDCDVPIRMIATQDEDSVLYEEGLKTRTSQVRQSYIPSQRRDLE